MAWSGSRLAIVLKFLKNGSAVMVKLGVMLVKRGFCTDDEIRAHNETRSAVGLPSIEEEESMEEGLQGHGKHHRPARGKRQQAVRRGGKTL